MLLPFLTHKLLFMKPFFKFLTLPLLLLCFLVSAQVKTNFNNESVIDEKGRFVKPYKVQADFEISAKDIDTLLQIEKRESQKSNNEKPFQLAVPVSINWDIAKSINWTTDGEFAYGKCTIKVNGALSSSINFDQFYLPSGTEMYIYNENGKMITGPITENENNLNKVWGSWVYKGPLLSIEIKTPSSTVKQLLLHSNNIAYGYKEVYAKVGGFGSSGSCEINVLCPLGNGWEAERNSVALILSDNGSSWCSGSMIMNTCSTNRPFFLTANHCFNPPGLPQQNVSAWRFTFQAWSPTCSPSQNSDGVTYNGSTLRANWTNSDFCLVELVNTPAANSGINYAGWTRSNVPAQSGTGIHHPSGDVMKISRANNQVTRTGWNGAAGTDHWQANWSPQNNGAGQTVTAVTEGGSSGSPLFDQNHRIVGQLHGGPSTCGGTQLWDYYGSFDVSWTGGGTNSTRLSNWLDPSGSGVTTTNTTNVSALFGTFQISGPSSFCNSGDYSVSNVPPGATVTWSASSGIVTLSPNGTQVTATRTSDGTFTMTATIATACGSYTTSSGYINVGSTNPWSGSIGGLDLNDNCTSTMKTPFVSDLGAGSSYQWYVFPGTPGTDYYLYNVDNNASLQFYTPGNYQIVVKATSSCGHAFSASSYYQAVDCYNYYRLSPNPATSDITVYVDEEGLKKQKIEKSSDQSIQKIIIVDKMGNALVQQSYPTDTRKVTLNIGGLSPDMYVVKIFHGQKWTSLKFLKQ